MMSRIDLLQEQYNELGIEILHLESLPFEGDFWIIRLDGSVEHSSFAHNESQTRNCGFLFWFRCC